MTTIECHYETIGRILSHLVKQGLARVTLDTSSAGQLVPEDVSGRTEMMAAFADVVHWMQSEHLIRMSQYNELEGHFAFYNVQLTARGIALIQAEPDGMMLGKSIERTVAEDAGEGLDASVYTKIGAFVGGLAGGFTKSIS